jgi:hypothetical protein
MQDFCFYFTEELFTVKSCQLPNTFRFYFLINFFYHHLSKLEEKRKSYNVLILSDKINVSVMTQSRVECQLYFSLVVLKGLLKKPLKGYFWLELNS